MQHFSVEVCIIYETLRRRRQSLSLARAQTTAGRRRCDSTRLPTNTLRVLSVVVMAFSRTETGGDGYNYFSSVKKRCETSGAPPDGKRGKRLNDLWCLGWHANLSIAIDIVIYFLTKRLSSFYWQEWEMMMMTTTAATQNKTKFVNNFFYLFLISTTNVVVAVSRNRRRRKSKYMKPPSST